ncbi:TPA: GlsB/YeaQ/YmgE family stress response membrane protein [Streptococcus equi subsp. equi]|nr:GlsB/YeaQ/YmgE family stress response membrane protein [Streptococcus equi subsp. equi]
MGIIWTLNVGALIGAIAGALTKKGGSMGWIANIAAGLIGSYVGQALFGSWGLTLAGMALFPSIIGAVIVVIITSFVLNKSN